MVPAPEVNADRQQRLQRQASIAELGRRALAADEFERVLQDASEIVTEALETEYTGLFEGCSGSDEVVLSHGSGWGDDVIGSTISLEQNEQIDEALHADGVVFFDEHYDGTHRSGDGLLASHGIENGLCISIGASERTWGVLGAYATTPRTFTQADATFVRNVATVLEGVVGDTPDQGRSTTETETETQYRSLVESFPNGIVTLFDADLTCRLPAGRGFDRFPIEADDLDGRSIRDVCDEDIAATLEPVCRSALDGETASVEFEDADRHWQVHTAPVPGEDGSITTGVMVAQEITKRKRQEQYLRDAKSQLEAATEAGAVGTWEWQIPEDRWVTHSFARQVGIEPEAARSGVSHDQFLSSIHEEDRERVERRVEEALESCGEYEAEYRVRNADDEIRWIVARGTVECDETGEPLRFRGALIDITERKRTEKRLEAHRNQLETLFEVLPIGVLVADADGQLVKANDTARTVWSGDVDRVTDVVGTDGYEWRWAETGEPVDPGEWTMARVLDGDVVSNPDVFEIEDECGEQRVVMVHGMPVRNECGAVSRGVITQTDVTERREYRRRLEESNERLEQFAYVASHDLQEPLRMITSYLRLIERRYGDELDDDGQEFIDYAVDGAERMREMIDGLLEYSRVETRGDPFDAVDLNGVIDCVLVDIRLQIEESDAEITVDDLPRVEGDAGQLRQVFQNLLSNAIEYSGEGSPEIHVSAERTGPMWTISVRDDGIGIDPTDQDRVFEVFQRLHSHEECVGTGIGLALCRRIVERHDGEIWVESEPGDGATFSFTLPAAS
ncbi:ATP-binding protein [Natrialbaceae archaeon A-arb3/5]